MDKNQAIVAGAVGFIVCALVVAGVILVADQKFGSHGHISTTPGIAVFADAACTKPLESIDWGSVSAGGSSYSTFYVKNTGNTNLLISVTPNNWQPSTASAFITITPTVLNPNLNSQGAVTEVDLVLYVSPAIFGITDFAVDISVSGTA